MRISDWSSDVCSSDLIQRWEAARRVDLVEDVAAIDRSAGEAAAQNVKSKRSDAGFFPDRRIRQFRQLVDERTAVRACDADREVPRARHSGAGSIGRESGRERWCQ